MVVNNWDISLPGSILESALFVVEKGVRKNNSHPVKNHATYCNLHGGVGIPQQNLIPRLTFHFMKIIKKTKNKKTPRKHGAGTVGFAGDGVGGGVALSIKGKQAGWQQLGFSIQFSCPEPWKTG